MLLGLGWSQPSQSSDGLRARLVVLVGRMGTVWGCAGSSGGFVESGLLPVGYKGSVCEGFDSAPPPSPSRSLQRNEVNGLSVSRREQL